MELAFWEKVLLFLALPVLIGGLIALILYRLSKKHQTQETDRLIKALKKEIKPVPTLLSLGSLPAIPEERHQKIALLAKSIGEEDLIRFLDTQSLVKLGIAMSNFGNYPEALVYYNEALKQAKALSDKEVKAICLINIGLIEYNKANLDIAKKRFTEA